MENSTIRKRLIYSGIFMIILTVILLSGCEKNNSDINKSLLGTWISTDLVDTIEFTTDKDFYKRIYSIKDHFDYSLKEDSITMRYNGVLYIYVLPTTHKYKIKADLLTIDFRPHCYGFREQEIQFKKK